MAVPTLTIEQLAGRSGGASSVGAYGFTKSWRALAPSRDYHQGAVLLGFVQQTGIGIGSPWIVGGTQFDPYYERLEIYCVDLQIAEGEVVNVSGVLFQEWIITGRWEATDPAPLGVRAIPALESDAPIKIRWDEWVENAVVDADKDGQLILNSALDRFSEPVETEKHYPLLRITRYERTFTALKIQNYRDKVNSVAWVLRGATYPARYAKCISITAEEKWHQEIGRYFEVNYEFAIRPESWAGQFNGSPNLSDIGQGWDLRVANLGYRDRVGTYPTATWKVIVDANGEPRPLDPNTGVALPVPLDPSVEMPKLTFRILQEVDFNSLGFPRTA